MIAQLIKALFGTQHERELKKLIPLLHKINELESWALTLTSDEFPKQTQKFKEDLTRGKKLDDILPQAFALAREAARRTLGERPYDVQILGGLVLHQGRIMEMKTGEGKTLSSVAAAYLNALPGRGVHMVTVNDYLAERDSRWMQPVFNYLGLSVGCILSQMDNETRKLNYSKDITYATNNELGFDYLRDNMVWDLSQKVQRGHYLAIIDEIDSILIDEARTPLIISGAVEDDTRKFQEVDSLVGLLTECEKDPTTGDYPENPVGDYKRDEKGKRISFTDQGMNKIEQILLKRKLISDSLFNEENFEYIHYFTQALKAHTLFHKDVDYVVQDGKVEIVDEFTGRILHGRRYSDGLHQAIEAKEKIRVAQQNKTIATITFQNYFRMYEKLAGMTGTADTEAKEFSKIYNLDVTVIPTNRPVARVDDDDLIYFSEDQKNAAIVKEIQEVHSRGQPILVGTVSIEKSEKLSNLLLRKGIRHEVLNAKNHHREALIIAEAGAKGAVTIATNMAGRGTDIKLGGNPEFRARKKAGPDAPPEVYAEYLARELEQNRKDYEEVKTLGGLYVLGTERHESRRIDNQLRGRSGRQGDPGRSRFYVSLDDTLMRLFASDSTRAWMARMGMDDGEPLFHPWLSKSLENAQKKVEERNFEIRKHLLEYDDVLSQQRVFIYQHRDKILADQNLKERVLQAGLDLLEEILEPYTKDRVLGSNAPIILEMLHDYFAFTTAPQDGSPASWTLDRLQEKVRIFLTQDLLSKEEIVGPEILNQFIRYEYLRKIDSLWQAHLENMEALREAVYLRSYAQKNPLVEYKLEGAEMFDQLIVEIRTYVARKIFKVRFQQSPVNRQERRLAGLRTDHVSMGAFGALGASASGGGSGQAMPQRGQARSTTVVRTVPKVGRNDPCPCGSGKKYKHCHGKFS